MRDASKLGLFGINITENVIDRVKFYPEVVKMPRF